MYILYFRHSISSISFPVAPISSLSPRALSKFYLMILFVQKVPGASLPSSALSRCSLLSLLGGTGKEAGRELIVYLLCELPLTSGILFNSQQPLRE